MGTRNFRPVLVLVLVVSSCLALAAQIHSPRIEQLGQGKAVSVGRHSNVWFEPNRGQFSPDALFSASAHGFRLDIGARGLDFFLQKRSSNGRMFRIGFIGDAPSSKPAGRTKLPGRSNYYFGPKNTDQIVGVPHFESVERKSVWPGVDFVVYSSSNSLEYDFEVQPGGDPTGIRLSLNKGTGVTIDEAGRLVLKSGTERLVFQAPSLYQLDSNGNRAPVSGSFKLEEDHTVGFAVGEYDHGRTLVIDPVLLMSEFLAIDIPVPSRTGVDSAGNLFVAGFSTTDTFRGVKAGFTIVKWQPDGVTVVYKTVVTSSTTNNSISDLLVAPGGSAYLNGTGSCSMPVSAGAFRTDCDTSGPLPSAAFVFRLDPQGALGACTFLHNFVYGMALDSSENVYLIGDFDFDAGKVFAAQLSGVAPITSGKAHVIKLDSNLSTLLYSATIRGFDQHKIPADILYRNIAVSPQGAIHLVALPGGLILPLKFPSDVALNSLGGPLLARISADGFTLDYLVPFGPSSSPPLNVAGMVVTSQNEVYLVGNAPRGLPVTVLNPPSLCESSSSDCTDGSLIKMDSTGKLVYSSLLPFKVTGTMDSLPSSHSLALDAQGNISILGNQLSGGPVEQSGFEPPLSGMSLLLAKFDSQMNSLYLAPLGGDFANLTAGSISLTPDGDIFVAGSVEGSDYPVLKLEAIQVDQNLWPSTFAAKISSGSGARMSLSRLTPVLTLRNVGDQDIHVTGISVSSNFQLVNACGGLLPVKAKCYLNVSSKPAAPQTGSVTVTTSELGTMNIPVVSQDTALFNVLMADPSSLVFQSQMIGTVSAPQTARLTNVSPGALALTVTDPVTRLQMTNGCPSSLPSGASCTVDVRYAPSTLSDFGSSISASAPGINTVFVSAFATPTDNPLALDNTSNIYSVQVVGGKSLAQLFRLRNTSTSPVPFTVSGADAFDVTNDCSGTVPSLGSCFLTFHFAPVKVGEYLDTVKLQYAGFGFLNIYVGGRGVTNGRMIFERSFLDFGSLLPGYNPTLDVLLSNYSGADRTIDSVSLPPDFTQQNDCGTPLPANGSCRFTLTFTPTGVGDRSGNLAVTFLQEAVPATVAIHAAAADIITFPAEVDFPDVFPGNISTASFAFATGASVPFTISSLQVEDDSFQVTQNNCPNPIPTFWGCFVTLSFRPDSLGPKTGMITVNSTDPRSPRYIQLKGNGVDIQVSLTRPTRPPRPGSSDTVIARSAFNVSITPPVGHAGSIHVSCNVPNGVRCEIRPDSILLSAHGEPAHSDVELSIARGARRLGQRLTMDKALRESSLVIEFQGHRKSIPLASLAIQ